MPSMVEGGMEGVEWKRRGRSGRGGGGGGEEEEGEEGKRRRGRSGRGGGRGGEERMKGITVNLTAKSNTRVSPTSIPMRVTVISQVLRPSPDVLGWGGGLRMRQDMSHMGRRLGAM